VLAGQGSEGRPPLRVPRRRRRPRTPCAARRVQGAAPAQRSAGGRSCWPPTPPTPRTLYALHSALSSSSSMAWGTVMVVITEYSSARPAAGAVGRGGGFSGVGAAAGARSLSLPCWGAGRLRAVVGRDLTCTVPERRVSLIRGKAVAVGCGEVLRAVVVRHRVLHLCHRTVPAQRARSAAGEKICYCFTRGFDHP
jgi:hypothetical protein